MSTTETAKEKKRFASVRLKGFGGYIQPLDKMDVFVSEIQDANVGDVWTVEIIEMSEEEHGALPEFQGY